MWPALARSTRSRYPRLARASASDRGLIAASNARALSAMKSLARRLVRDGKIEIGVLATQRGPRLPRTVPKPLNAAEAEAPLDNVDTLHDEPWLQKRDLAVLLLLYGCGLRISEALGLTRADAPKAGGMLAHHRQGRQDAAGAGAARGRRGDRRITSPPAPGRCAKDGPLFVGAKGGPLNPRLIQRGLQTLRAQLGLPETATPHALAPFLRDASAGRWWRSPRHPGIARPRLPLHHPALHRD